MVVAGQRCMAKKKSKRQQTSNQRRGIVTNLYPDENYGFLSAGEGGHEVRFAADVVARDEFDELRVGSEVVFEEAPGTDGPDAILVDLVSIPYPAFEEGEEPMASEDEVPEMPDTWQEK